ncbi:MAG: hypothetical protein ACPKPY_07150 [Nitrososphaeraceae archaeon]
MKKLQKSLTKEKYTMLLRILGSSKTPLSSYLLKNMMNQNDSNKSQHQYSYEMLNELCPEINKEYYEKFFRWDKIIDDKTEQKNALRILKKYFNIDFLHKSNIKYEFKKIGKNELCIESDSIYSIKIELPKVYGSKLTIFTNPNKIKEEKEIIREIYIHYENNVLFFPSAQEKIIPSKSKPSKKYIDAIYKTKIGFLDKKLKPEYQKIIEQKEKEISQYNNEINKKRGFHEGGIFQSRNISQLQEIEEIKKNKRLYQYQLNIRGLILYILGEIEREYDDKKNYNKRILNVLENLSKNYSKDFLFLLHFDFFRKCHIEIIKEGALQKYHEVELLKQISQELKDQLHMPLDYLRYTVTRRFSGEITYYLATCIRDGLIPYDDYSYLVPTIREYQLKNIRIMKEYLKDEYSNVNGICTSLENSNSEEKLVTYY